VVESSTGFSTVSTSNGSLIADSSTDLVLNSVCVWALEPTRLLFQNIYIRHKIIKKTAIARGTPKVIGLTPEPLCLSVGGEASDCWVEEADVEETGFWSEVDFDVARGEDEEMVFGLKFAASEDAKELSLGSEVDDIGVVEAASSDRKHMCNRSTSTTAN
jgi:hypothetical protein